MLIGGSNNISVSDPRNIYCSLEGYITNRLSGTKIILATLPHQNDLPTEYCIHNDTIHINAFMQEFTIRHVLKLLWWMLMVRSLSRSMANIYQCEENACWQEWLWSAYFSYDTTSQRPRNWMPTREASQDFISHHITVWEATVADGKSMWQHSNILVHHLDSDAQIVIGQCSQSGLIKK